MNILNLNQNFPGNLPQDKDIQYCIHNCLFYLLLNKIVNSVTSKLLKSLRFLYRNWYFCSVGLTHCLLVCISAQKLCKLKTKICIQIQKQWFGLNFFVVRYTYAIICNRHHTNMNSLKMKRIKRRSLTQPKLLKGKLKPDCFSKIDF